MLERLALAFDGGEGAAGRVSASVSSGRRAVTAAMTSRVALRRFDGRGRFAGQGVAFALQAFALGDDLLRGLGGARFLVAKLAHLAGEERQVAAVLDERLLDGGALLPEALLLLGEGAESGVVVAEGAPVAVDLRTASP